MSVSLLSILMTASVALITLGGSAYLDYLLARRRRHLVRAGLPALGALDSLALSLQLDLVNWLLCGLVAAVVTLFLIVCAIVGGPGVVLIGLLVVFISLALVVAVVARLAGAKESVRASAGVGSPAQERQAWPAANIKGLAGEQAGFRFAVAAGGLSIGRDPRNHLILADPKVSRRHARIQRAGNGFVLEDLGSGSGTLLNGRQVVRSSLQAGDEIEIRGSRFRFRLG